MINKYSYLIVFLGLTCLTRSANGQHWLQDSYADFSVGKLDGAGQNIYVSHDGHIRSIHRYDINQDGYIDLLFNDTHDFDYYIPATIAHVAAGRKVISGELAVRGSREVAASDLNGDGYNDLLFCPSDNGSQNARGMLTLLWGGADGWARSRNGGFLPVCGAWKVAVADLNHDRRPDIITLNAEAWLPGQPEGNIIRIYWGSARGYSLNRYRDIGIEDAISLSSGDFDSDGYQEIAVLTKRGIRMIWSGEEGAPHATRGELPFHFTDAGLPEADYLCITAADLTGDGRSDLVVGTQTKIFILPSRGHQAWGEITVVRGLAASSVTAADLDGDGSTDMVVSSSLIHPKEGGGMGEAVSADRNSIILWGDHGRFSPGDTSILAAPASIATAIADFDQDGHMDVICAVEHGSSTYDGTSVFFFGGGNRTFTRGKETVPGSAASAVAVAASKKGTKPQVILCNRLKGTPGQKVPLLLYWGASGGFDTGRCMKIPFASGYQSTAADLNGDGFVDLVSMNSMDGGGGDDNARGANIFWGTGHGLALTKPLVLHEKNAATCNVADLNRDGYLDLVIGLFDHFDKTPTELIIYYGSAGGFRSDGRRAIPCEGRSSSPTIADYNRDGWLDIAVSSYSKDMLRIFWGSKDGFNAHHQQDIEVPSVIDLETADLNSDGYLDMIACSYQDAVNGHHDAGVTIFWGSPDGFQSDKAQWLPADTPLGPVVADFDGDGYLDLFCPAYLGELSRENLPMNLYWGSARGFDPDNKTVLIGDSGTDGLAADFNQDGRMDLAVASHTVDGYHSKALTKIYYNDGRRFTSDSMAIQRLPSPGCHWMWNADMGNISSRKWEQSYTSAVFSWKKKRSGGKIAYHAEIPAGTRLGFEVRYAVNENSLAKAIWKKVSSGDFKLEPGDRCLQYRAIFISGNGDRYPVLDRVETTLE